MRHPLTLLLPLFALLFLIACQEADRDNSPPLAQTYESCETTACRERVQATVEATLDPPMRQILVENPAIKSIIGDGREREDYWLIIDPFMRPANGDQGGMVIVIFAEPVSFAGEGPTASQPCKGHFGLDERVDPDDPCLQEPREYGTQELTFAGIQVVHTQVDTGRGEVVRLFADDSSPDIVEDMIRWAEQTQYPPADQASPPPASPQARS